MKREFKEIVYWTNEMVEESKNYPHLMARMYDVANPLTYEENEALRQHLCHMNVYVSFLHQAVANEKTRRDIKKMFSRKR